MGQPAEVTIDAIPHKIFHGTVSEIGDNAIVRSTGVSTSQATSTSEEAKDFKVVVTLTDPPADLRPGLSSTAKITTATRKRRGEHSDPGVDGARTRRTWRRRSGKGSVQARPAPLRTQRSKRKKFRAFS